MCLKKFIKSIQASVLATEVYHIYMYMIVHRNSTNKNVVMKKLSFTFMLPVGMLKLPGYLSTLLVVKNAS